MITTTTTTTTTYDDDDNNKTTTTTTCDCNAKNANGSWSDVKIKFKDFHRPYKSYSRRTTLIKNSTFISISKQD